LKNSIYIALLILLAFAKGSFAQLSQEELDTCVVYTSIESALNNPEDVYILKLNKKKYKVLPKEILQFSNLQVLELKKNKLLVLPDELSQLINLETLDLSKNQFEVFPKCITELTNLKNLNLSQNIITAIPYAINNLKKLEYLDMWSNELYVIPESISELKSLKVFDLRVIQFTDKEKSHIKKLLPNTKVHFSNSCNCAN